MTDGIIHQVIDKKIAVLLAEREYMQSPVYKGKIDFAIKILRLVEPELIEKIKQEIGTPPPTEYFHATHYAILKKLIGDNKE